MKHEDCRATISSGQRDLLPGRNSAGALRQLDHDAPQTCGDTVRTLCDLDDVVQAHGASITAAGAILKVVVDVRGQALATIRRRDSPGL